MKPIDQTTFGKGKGNCFAACIASILEVGIDEVPNFVCEYKNWVGETLKWLNKRGFTGMFLTGSEEGVAFRPDCYHVVTGPSPRGDFLHAVVGRGDSLVHDPHPSREFFSKGKVADVFVIIPIKVVADSYGEGVVPVRVAVAEGVRKDYEYFVTELEKARKARDKRWRDFLEVQLVANLKESLPPLLRECFPAWRNRVG